MVRAILSRPYAEHLTLEPLSAEQSMELARQMLGEGAVTAEVEGLILDRTEGNPLFVEELTRALIEGGALSERAGAYALAQPSDELEIPATLQGVLLARIDRLSRELKEALRVAAAIGRVFSSAVLVEALPVDSPVDDLLSRLQDLDFVYRLGPGSDGDYSFKHVLAQEAVYSTLLKNRRAAYHEAIGTAIEDLYADRLEEYAEVLARHFEEAERPDRAVPTWPWPTRRRCAATPWPRRTGTSPGHTSCLRRCPRPTRTGPPTSSCSARTCWSSSSCSSTGTTTGSCTRRSPWHGRSAAPSSRGGS